MCLCINNNDFMHNKCYFLLNYRTHFYHCNYLRSLKSNKTAHKISFCTIFIRFTNQRNVYVYLIHISSFVRKVYQKPLSNIWFIDMLTLLISTFRKKLVVLMIIYVSTFSGTVKQMKISAQTLLYIRAY